ncbi:MAG: hypothetical protein AB1400_00445 [Pseudomonadota bacterium]
MLKTVIHISMIASTLLFAQAAAAKEPTIRDIYQTAQDGKLDEAQGMIDEVLKAHPNSAKAHFVKAELDSKQNHYAHAELELKQAESLQPSLSFAHPEAVQQMKARIANWHEKRAARLAQAQATAPTPLPPPTSGQSSGFGLNNLLVIAGLLLVIFFLAQMVRTQRMRNDFHLQTLHSGTHTDKYSHYGTGILPTLATGATLGVGAAAASEALADRFLDNNGNEDSQIENDFMPIEDSEEETPDREMDGEDFDLTDSSDWNNDNRDS